MFYDVRHGVDRSLHAIERNRILTGLALGYIPAGPIDYGLDRARFTATPARPSAILLHSSARVEKLWSEPNWIALARALHARGLEVVLPWGSEDERARALRIAAEIPDARIPARMELDEMARLIAGARLVVGVDTGLLHLAGAFGVALIAIFVSSEPGLTGPMGAGRIEVLGANGAPPPAAAAIQAAERLLDR
jgi:heptosyltransferase-1